MFTSHNKSHGTYWSLDVFNVTEEDMTPSRRSYIENMLGYLVEEMTKRELKEQLSDAKMAQYFEMRVLWFSAFYLNLSEQIQDVQ